MSNTVHICFSSSAGGCLKFAIIRGMIQGTRGKIISFQEDLSQGPLGSVISVDERINWWDMIEKDEDSKFRISEPQHLKDSYEEFYKRLQEIEPTDEIYIWYGQCAYELCAMMYTLEFLKDRLTNINLVDVTREMKGENSSIYTTRSMGEIDAEKLKEYLIFKRKISILEYEALLKQWNNLKNENSLFRVFIEGEVKSVGVDYFDIDILKYTEKEFKIASRTIGRVLIYSDTRISDSYIFWRVKELIRLGEIDFKGVFGHMREMEIKITEKGLKHIDVFSQGGQNV
jgi:DNA-binding Lrp family transcriptional regulator